MKNILAILIPVMFGSLSLTAQMEDAPKCKDSPMFSRLPNEYIQECSHNYNELVIPMRLADGETQSETKEGTLTFIQYVYFTETGAEAPSFFQISKNYENAILKTGGKKVYYDTNSGTSTLYTKSGNKEIWILLTDFSGTSAGNYELRILEIEGMKQEIDANNMLTALNTTGSIALYINFETGKADIKPESQKIIDEIALLLKANPSLRINVEGHTDNAGAAASNKTLSENRAKAVMNAVVSKGIDKTRLTSRGFGQEKPIADNSTEDGKTKNRRVEIVKL